VTVAKLLGHDWRKLRFAEEAESRGLGVRDPIDYRGVPLDQVAFQAWPGHKGYDYLPINFLVGDGVTLAGTIGHVKSVLDSMLRRGELTKVIWAKGTPTIMVGAIDDPNFEEHLKEGPYIVFDDAAKPMYKNDPRVHFVPGHPVLRSAMPQVMKGLGADFSGNAIMKWQQLERWGMHNLEYGSTKRKTLTISKAAAAAGLSILVIGAVASLLRRA
jgi:hypothetical protein